MNYIRKFSIFVGGVLTDAVLTFLFSFSLFTRHSVTNDAITWFEKLCDEIEVKICGADRVGRMVYASTDLTKTYENPFTPEKSVAKTIEDAQNRGKGVHRWGRQPGFEKVVKATNIPESPKTFRDKGEKVAEKGMERERTL